MKKVFALIIASFLFSVSARAAFEVMAGSGFSAPNYNGDANVGNPQSGDIILDINTGGFKGYDGSSWLSLGATSAPTAPNIQRFASSGSFVPTAGALWIKVRMVGGGGGGAGAGFSGTGSSGSNGNPTTFGTSFLIASGGFGGAGSGGDGGAGGSITVNSPAVDVASRAGQAGGPSTRISATFVRLGGASGGQTPFGGSGNGGSQAGSQNAGRNAAANSGSGGGGGASGSGTDAASGGGGGAGGYIEVIIYPPFSASYPITIGAGGAFGAGGSGSSPGGNGADGYVVVEEYFQ